MKLLMIIASVSAALLLSSCNDSPRPLVCDTFKECVDLSRLQANKQTLLNNSFSQLSVSIALAYEAGGKSKLEISKPSGSDTFDAVATAELQRSVEALLAAIAKLPKNEREQGDSIHTHFVIKTTDFPEPVLQQQFYDNGQLKSRGYILVDNKVGHWQGFYTDSTLKFDINYATGEQHFFDPNGELIVEKAIAAAKIMNRSHTNNDLDTYISFIPSKMLESVGGVAGAKRELAIAQHEAQREGVKNIKTTLINPTQAKVFLQEGGTEFYVSLPIKTSMLILTSNVFYESALIGLSEDSGANWTFTSVDSLIGIDSEIVKLILPTLPDEIEIPATQPTPQFIDDLEDADITAPTNSLKFVDQNGELIVEKSLAAAKSMRQSIINKDYDYYMRFVLSKQIANAGGEASLKQEMATMMDKLQSKGLKLEATTFNQPAKIYHQSEIDEYYVYLPMENNMSSPLGNIIGESALIGLSKDNGENWKFVEALGGRETVQLLLPNLPDELDIMSFPGPRLINN